MIAFSSSVESESSILRLFVKALRRSVWAYLTVVSTAITLYFLPRQWRWGVPIGLAVLVVIGAFRAVEIIRNEYEAKIGGLQQEIERLKVRPYDLAQGTLAETKIRPLSVVSRDLLRYLLQHGPEEAPRLYALALSTGLDNPTFHETFMALRQRELIQCPPEQSLWHVNPRYEGILEDLLFPRDESEPWRHFLP